MTTKEEIRKIMEDTIESPYVSRFHRTAMGRALTLFNGLAPNHTADKMREWMAKHQIYYNEKYDMVHRDDLTMKRWWLAKKEVVEKFFEAFPAKNSDSSRIDPWQSYLQFAKEMQYGTDNA